MTFGSRGRTVIGDPKPSKMLNSSFMADTLKVYKGMGALTTKFCKNTLM